MKTNNNCHNNCTIIYGLQLKPSGILFCFTLVIIHSDLPIDTESNGAAPVVVPECSVVHAKVIVFGFSFITAYHTAVNIYLYSLYNCINFTCYFRDVAKPYYQK